MSKYMLNDEDAINDVNPFVTHDFSLPGGVRQTGDFEDFSEMRSEPGIPEQERSVYCDYGLCKESTSECSLSRPLHPRRNIDTGFTKNDRTFIQKVVVGVAKNPKFSIIGASILLMTILLIVYYIRR
ncbi:hypothetical protein OlV1_139c [Ostreococcus lucimarinus virus 1]|uniref:hypothetical protein n=1 Tax=Ostreococcus lucimarinus virus 1 TaxID=880162 RepID=UPI0001EF4610|nr:hypothetical protein OlV1_139c [Ostreococcus lucimarinus virus 1]ADQ91516.1 hypothetical protein OlV1_139c [Ostreococcus lucimarinus virus 1]QBP06564.1 hypothetical protein OlV1_gene112 [Ostreococcus lucimarinus virus 1]